MQIRLIEVSRCGENRGREEELANAGLAELEKTLGEAVAVYPIYWMAAAFMFLAVFPGHYKNEEKKQ